MQRPVGASPSKLLAGVRRPVGSPSRLLLAGFVAPAALLAGCGSGGGDLISSVALPSQQTAGYTEGVDVASAPQDDRQAAKLALTGPQRDYLDALAAAGVHPSSELRALSIGSYVCQARAAGQSEQKVWDSVAPMVRSDIADAHAAAAQTPTAEESEAAVGHYIGIATQRLC
ncbi:MAG: DUF732 domain-containing protein [Mycobacterium sp.]